MKISLLYPEQGEYKPVFTGAMNVKSVGAAWCMFDSPKFCQRAFIPRVINPGDLIRVEDDPIYPIPKYIGEFKVQICRNGSETFYYSSLEEKRKVQGELVDTYGIMAITDVPYERPRLATKPGVYVVTDKTFVYYGG